MKLKVMALITICRTERTPSTHHLRNLAFLLTTAIPLCVLLFMIAKYSVEMPYMDEWDLVPLIDQAFRGDLTFQDLWAQHNEHRIVFPQLLLVSLATWTSWNAFYELYLMVALAAGILLLVCKIMLRGRPALTQTAFVWLLPVLSAAAFSLRQWESWMMGVNNVIYLSVLGAFAGIYLLSSGKFGWKQFWGGAALGIFSTYSFSTGFVYWPIGLFLLFFSNFPETKTKRAAIVLWVIVAAAAVGLYKIGYVQPSHLPRPLEALKHPMDLALYVVLYLGSLMPSSFHISFLAGITGLVCFCFLAIQLFKSPGLPRAAFLGLAAIGLFVILNAVITGLGRVETSIYQAMSSRYVTISWPFWASVLGLGAMAGAQSTGIHARIVNLAAYVTIALGIVTASAGSTEDLKTRSALLSEGQAELFRLENDALLRQINPDVAALKNRVRILQERKLSAFR